MADSRASSYAISDGNSFYCSCERVFDPKLKRVPVIVLSNNDGCAVARTPEAKALGIRMDEPYFRYPRAAGPLGARTHPRNALTVTSVNEVQNAPPWL